MHWKIVVVFSAIVVLVGLMAQLLLGSLNEKPGARPASSKQAVVRQLHTADLQLRAESQAAQRWLTEQARSESLRLVYSAGTPRARGESATAFADEALSRAHQGRGLFLRASSLVVLVDPQGTVLGQNGGALMRGEQLARHVEDLTARLELAEASGLLWVNQERKEQFIVSLAPVLDSGGSKGAVLLGVPINDELLAEISGRTTGAPLAVFDERGEVSVVLGAHALPRAPRLPTGWTSAGADEPATFLPGSDCAVRGLLGASQIALISCADPPSGAGPHSAVWLAVLVGLLLTAIASVALANYVTRPVSALEDGLLQVLGGDHSVRFELEHAELGGLVSQINAVLNELTNVRESEAPPDTADLE